MDSRYNIDELRFVTKDDQITEVYVFCRPLDDDCPYVQGWHYKAFPASLSCVDIYQKHFGDHILWPLRAP